MWTNTPPFLDGRERGIVKLVIIMMAPIPGHNQLQLPWLAVLAKGKRLPGDGKLGIYTHVNMDQHTPILNGRGRGIPSTVAPT